MRKFFLSGILLLAFTLSSGQNSWAMFFSNGDFETGDLSGYFVQEDFADVGSSPLANAVDDGTGNHVGELLTGFTGNGVTNITLGRDIGTMPLSAENLFFDFRVFDAGDDAGGGSNFIDLLTIALLTDSGDLNPILTADTAGYSVLDPSLTNVSLLSNGFYRVNTNVSGFGGANNSRLFFDLLDDDDARLTKAWIDNLDLTLQEENNVIPEPATMMMLGAGFLSLISMRRKILEV
jgi:hypothetical protein